MKAQADTSIQAGTLKATAREIRKLPRKGQIKVYILATAQNDTHIHELCFRNILAYAKHRDAEIMVAGFTYAVNSRASLGEKKTSRETSETVEAWAPEIEPYLVDRRVQLAPGLVWCGDLQILPTAPNPLSGLESLTGRDSSIIPHVTFAVESVASPKGHGTKFLYTTGTVTQRHYIQKKAGQKAEFHHGYGGLIVEVCHDGVWFVRQLNADSEGTFYDLDIKVANGRVTAGHRPEALVWGDIHTRQLEAGNRALGWAPGGILDVLRPKRQVLHDVLDFRSQNHHDRKDPHKTYAKHVEGGLSVEDEIKELAEFLEFASRPWCETAIAAANHDEALLRWMKEADFREDPVNAEFYLNASLATYKAIKAGAKNFLPVEWAVGRWTKRKLRWLRRDEEYLVCPDANGGIDLSNHGDIGLNGSRGGLKQFAKTGRKVIIAHGHGAGLFQGAMMVGVMGSLDMGYNRGFSNWSHTNALVHPNGKRQLFTIWRGRWRA